MVRSSQHNADYIPVCGGVVESNFNPQAEKRNLGSASALVLSSWNFNRTKNVAFICPITRTARGSRFEVEIPEGYEVHSFIRADQVKSLDWLARKAIFLCAMPNETVIAISNMVETIIWGY